MKRTMMIGAISILLVLAWPAAAVADVDPSPAPGLGDPRIVLGAFIMIGLVSGLSLWALSRMAAARKREHKQAQAADEDGQPKEGPGDDS